MKVRVIVNLDIDTEKEDLASLVIQEMDYNFAYWDLEKPGYSKNYINGSEIVDYEIIKQ